MKFYDFLGALPQKNFVVPHISATADQFFELNCNLWRQA
jgi:hypothetical protein